jgi:DNA-directed RNA polymerase specialized sigma24 family protein
VLKSFFIRNAAGQFTLSDEDNLWAVLAAMTVYKCGHRVEKYSSKKRAVSREKSLSDKSATDRPAWEALSRDPAPEEATMLAEMVENLMRPLSKEDRKVLEMRLQGYEIAEIVAETGRAERSVYRVLAEVRERIKK